MTQLPPEEPIGPPSIQIVSVLEKPDLIFAIRRPDGAPTSVNGALFRKELKQHGFLVVGEPGSNDVYIASDRGDMDDTFVLFMHVLPGDWVVFSKGAVKLFSDEAFRKQFIVNGPASLPYTPHP